MRIFARKYELEIIVRKSGHQWKYGSEDSIIPCSQYLRNHWGGYAVSSAAVWNSVVWNTDAALYPYITGPGIQDDTGSFFYSPTDRNFKNPYIKYVKISASFTDTGPSVRVGYGAYAICHHRRPQGRRLQNTVASAREDTYDHLFLADYLQTVHPGT